MHPPHRLPSPPTCQCITHLIYRWRTHALQLVHQELQRVLQYHNLCLVPRLLERQPRCRSLLLHLSVKPRNVDSQAVQLCCLPL